MTSSVLGPVGLGKRLVGALTRGVSSAGEEDPGPTNLTVAIKVRNSNRNGCIIPIPSTVPSPQLACG